MGTTPHVIFGPTNQFKMVNRYIWFYAYCIYIYDSQQWATQVSQYQYPHISLSDTHTHNSLSQQQQHPSKVLLLLCGRCEMAIKQVPLSTTFNNFLLLNLGLP